MEAVVDKDLSTCLLGLKLIERAKTRGEQLEGELVILTNVDGAKLNYQKPDQTDLRFLTVKQARQLLADKVFAPGSMAPKVMAAVRFLEGGGKKAMITAVSNYQQTLAGQAGTTFIP